MTPDSDSTGGALPSPSFYLKASPIKGDAAHREHPGEITVLSWSFGANQKVLSKEDAKKSASVSIKEFKFSAISGSASPQLFQYCASGKKLKSVTLTCIKPKGKGFFTYLTIELSNVVVSAYDIEGKHGDHRPTDEFSLSFEKIEMKFSADNDGFGSVGRDEGSPPANVTCSWDLSLDR